MHLCYCVHVSVYTILPLYSLSPSIHDADIDRLTEVFVEDPEDQSGAVGSQVVFSCRYHEGGVGFRRGWSWEFYQQGGNRFTIRDNASLP